MDYDNLINVDDNSLSDLNYYVTESISATADVLDTLRNNNKMDTSLLDYFLKLKMLKSKIDIEICRRYYKEAYHD